MKREELEELVGESMEDMGLVEHVEELECECCGAIFEDGRGTMCVRCRIDYPYCH